MHDAAFMGSIERIGNLDSDMPRFLEGKRALREPRLERRAFDDLHDDDLSRADAFEAVNARDVRMIERGEHLRFAGESRDAIRVVEKAVRQDLERNIATELCIASAIHRSHPAFAEFRGDHDKGRAYLVKLHGRWESHTAHMAIAAALVGTRETPVCERVLDSEVTRRRKLLKIQGHRQVERPICPP